ncbi:hypothetical protein [Achromobacter phage SE2]|nr:hypothetical protein [Achromobacter phage SE2]
MNHVTRRTCNQTFCYIYIQLHLHLVTCYPLHSGKRAFIYIYLSSWSRKPATAAAAAAAAVSPLQSRRAYTDVPPPSFRKSSGDCVVRRQ